jgi:mono/diheme cytochrome c family protein
MKPGASMKMVGLFAVFVVAGAWCRVGSLVQQAPPEAVICNNPLDSNQQARRAGAKLYARECAGCHGGNREGQGKAPPLHRADIYRASPGALFWVLRNGSLHTGMPSFAHLPEAQRWQIITWLQDRTAQ